MKYRNSSRQSGFTLVEIAIVLVIIGLLLGGVLKGQEMIENAKVKNAVNDIHGVAAAYNSYVDRFRRLPGDDGPTLVALTARGGAWLNITDWGNANGSLNVPAASAFTAPVGAGGGVSEEVAFFQHLKASGFMAGNPADLGLAALPRNAFNGLTTVVLNTVAATTGAPIGLSVCLGQVPGKAARQIDTQLDDGNGLTGLVRSTLSGAPGTNVAPGVATAAFVDTSQYTICVGM